MMMKIYFLIAIVCVLIGCDGSSTNPDVVSDESFDVVALRQTIIDVHVTPAHDNLVTLMGVLNERIIDLSEDLSADNLDAAKQAWLASAKAYSKTELFNIRDVEDSYIHFGIFGWGALESSIETTISDNESLEGFDLNTLPTNSRGFSAIEYLLFHESESETLSSLAHENRITYLLLLGENLSDKINTLADLWEGQRTSFVTSSESGLDEGINQIVNSINNNLSIVKKLKIGLPAGLESTGIDTEALQADISGNSLELIASNLEIIEAFYFTGDPNLSEYVTSIAGNSDINDAFLSSFENINNTIAKIDGSLALAITEQPAEVEALHTEVIELIRLFTTDVSSVLSLTVTPTDADGD